MIKEEEKQKIIEALERIVMAKEEIDKIMEGSINKNKGGVRYLALRPRTGENIVHYENLTSGIYKDYQIQITKLENKKIK